MDRIKFVWAKNKQEFGHCCRDMGWTEGPDVRYMASRMHLLGKHDIDIIKYGSYYMRRGFHEENEQVELMQEVGLAEVYAISLRGGRPSLMKTRRTLGRGFGV